MTRDIIREQDNIKLVRVIEDENSGYSNSYVVMNGEDKVASYYDSDGKDFAYIKAMSCYLKETGFMGKSYEDLMNAQSMLEVQNTTIPYSRLKEIAHDAIMELNDDERKTFVEGLLDIEADYLDVVDKPYRIREYTVRMTSTMTVTVAVTDDMDDNDIERKLEEYCDNQDHYAWDFEEYDFDEYDDGCENYTAEDAEDEANIFIEE